MQPSPQYTFFNTITFMFNVIRIPTKFTRWIDRMSKNDRLDLFDLLRKIWGWEKIVVPDTVVWDTLSLIYGEWMNMESRNWVKPKESLLIVSSEWVGTETPSDSEPRVEYSRLEENRVDESRELIATKVATLEAYIKKEFDSSFISEIYSNYKIPKDDFQDECRSFVLYWTEKSPNWKKERWEKEKTFDPKLRFRNWMRNNKKWSNRVMVNSDDEERKEKLAEIERKKKELFNKI